MSLQRTLRVSGALQGHSAIGSEQIWGHLRPAASAATLASPSKMSISVVLTTAPRGLWRRTLPKVVKEGSGTALTRQRK